MKKVYVAPNFRCSKNGCLESVFADDLCGEKRTLNRYMDSSRMSVTMNGYCKTGAKWFVEIEAADENEE